MGIRKFLLRVVKNFKFLPVKNILKYRYEYYTGKKLNLENPVEFNEKIQWLKLYYQHPLLTQLACKYNVRSYVEEKIGKKYLNELYGCYETVDEIDFDSLPNQFVLKGVQGSSLNIIVSDKNKLDIDAVKQEMSKWLHHDQYARVGYEWAYKNIKPLIICEKFLKEPGREVLNDYKFFCFNGEPKYVQIDMDRGVYDYRCYYDLDWNKLSFNTVKNTFYEGEVDKPGSFEEMKLLAKKLAGDLPFSRVDFYNIDGQIVFGEITFYPADGKKDFVPDSYNKTLGDLIILPNVVVEN